MAKEKVEIPGVGVLRTKQRNTPHGIEYMIDVVLGPSARWIVRQFSRRRNAIQAGAQMERDAVRAHVKRCARSLEWLSCEEFLAWLDGRPFRYDAKPGGLSGDRKSKSNGKVKPKPKAAKAAAKRRP